MIAPPDLILVMPTTAARLAAVRAPERLRRAYRDAGMTVPDDVAELLAEIDDVGDRYRQRIAEAVAAAPPVPLSVDGTVPLSLTTGPVADRLGVTERQARRLCQSGKLPARKEHGRWVVDPGDLAS